MWTLYFWVDKSSDGGNETGWPICALALVQSRLIRLNPVHEGGVA